MLRYFIIGLLCLAKLYAEPFGQYKITKASGSVIKGASSIETGSNSRVELIFSDGTIARIGSNSKFRYIPGSREAILDGGTLLVSLPRDVGGILLHTNSVVVTATEGDFQIANVQGGSKVISLNGKITTSLTSNLAEKVKLKPGHIVTVPPGTAKFDVDVINLQILISSSKLMSMGPLPSQTKIEINARKQKGPPNTNPPGANNSIFQTAQGANRIAALDAQQQLAQQLAAQQLAEEQAAQQLANARQFAAQQRQAQLLAEQAKGPQGNQGQGPQGNQGKGPQGNQGNAFGPGGNQGQGNQGKPPNVPPGQAKK